MGKGAYRDLERGLISSGEAQRMRLVIFGSGNVATHIAKPLSRHHDIIQIVSRNPVHGDRLAKTIGGSVDVTTRLSEVRDDADAYIISVNDDSVADIVAGTPGNGLWMHTSGSVGMDVFHGHKRHYGVLYPLQTFSRDIPVDMQKVPIFIEGNDSGSTADIDTIAKSISHHIYHADSSQRRQLHIAAVFACNFANRLWAIADDILKEAGYDFSVLSPLLKATLEKAERTSPAEGQTGPARRGDRQVMESHLNSLNAENAEIYKIISKSIFNQYNEQN